MWTVVQMTTYETSTASITPNMFVIEGGSLELCLCEAMERLVKVWDDLSLEPPEPFLGVMMVALSVTCTPSSTQAVTRDTEAVRTLQLMKDSLASFLSSSGGPPKEGTKGTSNGSRPK